MSAYTRDRSPTDARTPSARKRDRSNDSYDSRDYTDYSDSFVSETDSEYERRTHKKSTLTKTNKRNGGVTKGGKKLSPRGKTTQRGGSELKQRLVSAKQGRMKQLVNEKMDIEQKLEEVQQENRLLKRQQFLQDKAILKYESQDNSFSQVLHSHNEEVRALREQLRKQKLKAENNNKKLKDKDDELYQVQKKLKKLERIVQDKRLDERDNLNRKLGHVELELEEKEKRVKELEKHLHHLEKNHRRELAIEMTKSKDSSKNVDDLEERIRHLEIQLKEKEKALEIKNIYSNRRPPHRLTGLESSMSSPTPTLPKLEKNRRRSVSPARITPRDLAKQLDNERREKEKKERGERERKQNERDEEDRKRYEVEEREKQRQLNEERERKRKQQVEQDRREKEEQKRREDDEKKHITLSREDSDMTFFNKLAMGAKTDNKTKEQEERKRREKEEIESREREESKRKEREEREWKEREEIERRERIERERDKIRRERAKAEQEQQQRDSELRRIQQEREKEESDREKRRHEEEERQEREEQLQRDREATLRREQEEKERWDRENRDKDDERRKQKDLLLAKLKDMDGDKLTRSDSGELSPGTRRREQKEWNFSKPVENLHHGRSAYDDVKVPYLEKQKREQKKKLGLFDDDNDDDIDNDSVGYQPSFGRRGANDNKPKNKSIFDDDSPVSSAKSKPNNMIFGVSDKNSSPNTKSNKKKDNDLLGDLFGKEEGKTNNRNSLGDDDIFATSTKAKPVTPGTYPWEKEVKVTKTGAPKMNRPRQPSNVLDSKPAVNAIDSFDIDDIEEVVL